MVVMNIDKSKMKIDENSALLKNFSKVKPHRTDGTLTVRDFIEAGYPNVYMGNIKNNDWHGMIKWCNENFSGSGFILFNYRLFFASEGDHVLFRLRWGQQ